MLLSEVLRDVEYDGTFSETEIKGVTCDSRRVEPGYVFVCVSGSSMDGHEYAVSARNEGASVIVAEHETAAGNELIVRDSRKAYAVMCANICGRPADRLKIIGITGTNGKTTITYLIKHILEQNGKKVGLIGTIQNIIGSIEIPAKYTTPDPAELHTVLRRMALAGCEYVVMEVSSQALDQQRVAGIQFDTAVFTNLTQDHLDYHKTMENYFAAKKKLFLQCNSAVVSIDDSYGETVRDEALCPVKTVSMTNAAADYTAFDIKSRIDGCRFAMVADGDIRRVNISMPGSFSVSNAMLAIAASVSEGISLEKAVEAMNSCPGVKGRMEIIPNDRGFTVIRDFAHGPEALRNLLDTVKECTDGKIVTVFGAAGRRDRLKRPAMGTIVAERSDSVVFTSDNPREEPFSQILDDTMPGFAGFESKLTVEPDRYKAIETAVSMLGEGDVLVLAGKGHEEYQVLSEGTICFDEKDIVTKMLSGK